MHFFSHLFWEGVAGLDLRSGVVGWHGWYGRVFGLLDAGYAFLDEGVLLLLRQGLEEDEVYAAGVMAAGADGVGSLSLEE